jgi:hypothetical protein
MDFFVTMLMGVIMALVVFKKKEKKGLEIKPSLEDLNHKDVLKWTSSDYVKEC